MGYKNNPPFFTTMRQKSSSSLLKEVKRRNKIKIGCLLLYLCIQKRFARLYFSKNAFSSLLAAFENKSRFTLIFSTTLLLTKRVFGC